MIELHNEHLTIRILPELGGKITSLFDRRHGREWLWTNPHIPRLPPVYGESYVERLDTGGWDEIFPSISPCQLSGGVSIPDHGELVSLPAEVHGQTATQLSLTTPTRGVATEFTRKLTLEGRRLQIDYTLKSLDDDSIPYLWAAHPLIALEDGMVLKLPTSDLTSDEGLDLETTSDGGCRIKIEDPALGKVKPHMLKCFTGRNLADEVTIQAVDGSSLRLSWNRRDAPYFGIWLNQRGWSGVDSEPYFNLGLEPTTSPHDDLLSAVAADEHFILGPRESHEWSIEIFLN